MQLCAEANKVTSWALVRDIAFICYDLFCRFICPHVTQEMRYKLQHRAQNNVLMGKVVLFM